MAERLRGPVPYTARLLRILAHWLGFAADAQPDPAEQPVWQQGYDAHEAGLRLAECPHPPGIRSEIWRAGYKQAEAAFLRAW